MDGLYACGPVIRSCRQYGWDYMLVFKEGSLKDVWREVIGLINLTPENTRKLHCGGRNQVYRWINDVEFAMVQKAKIMNNLNRLQSIVNNTSYQWRLAS
jgi:hypothetical protein